MPASIYSARPLPHPTVRLFDAQDRERPAPTNVKVRTDPPGILLVSTTSLTALANGTVTLTVEVQDAGLTQQFPIRVVVVDQVAATCAQRNCQYAVGDAIRVAVTAQSQGRPVSNLAPARFTSARPEVVSVEASGMLRARSPGRAEVYAVVGDAQTRLKIYVSAPPDDITVQCPGPALERDGDDLTCTVDHGASLVLSARVMGQDEPVYGADLRWRAENAEVVTVNQEGQVFGRSLGRTTVFAHIQDVQGKLEVRVVQRTCTKRTWKTTSIRRYGQTYRYRCRARNPEACIAERLKKKLPFREILDNCCCEALSRRRWR